MKKAEAVLKYIGEAGKNGRSFSEIQKFVVTMNGLDWDEQQTEPACARTDPKFARKMGYNVRTARRWRGYWCDYLLGGFEYGKRGLLKVFCRKSADRRWVLIRKPKLFPGWSRIRGISRS